MIRSLALAGTGVAGGCLGLSEPERTPISATDTGLSGTVKVAGSSTVYPLTLRIANQFADGKPDVSVVVTATGTGGGFSDFFCVGETDINDASRPITDAERERCRANDIEFVRFQIATDALTVIANADADWVDCVTPAELAALWRHNGATQWRDVRSTWPSRPIDHYGPTFESGTLDYFANTILTGDSTHRRDFTGTEQDSVIVENVEQSDTAIGYLGLAYYQQNTAGVKALAIDDGDGCVSPSISTAGSAYHLSRPLFLYVTTDAIADAVVQSFLQYYLEQVDTSLVSDMGYAPVDSEIAARNREKLDRVIAEHG